MKPNWLDNDKKEAQSRKVRVLARQPEFDEVREDQEREDAYQQLMEDTGRSY